MRNVRAITEEDRKKLVLRYVEIKKSYPYLSNAVICERLGIPVPFFNKLKRKNMHLMRDLYGLD